MGLGERGVGRYRDLANKGVREELVGKNRELCRRETDINFLYR